MRTIDIIGIFAFGVILASLFVYHLQDTPENFGLAAGKAIGELIIPGIVFFVIRSYITKRQNRKADKKKVEN